MILKQRFLSARIFLRKHFPILIWFIALAWLPIISDLLQELRWSFDVTWGCRKFSWVYQKMCRVFWTAAMFPIIVKISSLKLLPRTLSIQSHLMWNIKVCVEGRDSWLELIGFMSRHSATLLCLHPKQKIFRDYFFNVCVYVHMLIFIVL